MFSQPLFLLLLGVIYVRPQEFIHFLDSIPLLPLLFYLTLFGYLVDLKLRIVSSKLSPHTYWMLAFLGWALMTVLIRAPSTLSKVMMKMFLTFLVGFLTSNSIRTFRAMNTIAVLLGLIMIYLFVGMFYQANQPFVCMKINEKGPDPTTGEPDGRPCGGRAIDCADGEPGAEYRCERPGLMDTNSIAGRVRYRGVLQDPNDLSLAIGIALPLLIALVRQRPTRLRIFAMLCFIVVAFWAILPTQSRGGQLSFMLIMAIHVFLLFGLRTTLFAGIPGAAIALILMLLQPEREDAESSSEERVRCQWNALHMFKFYPLTGVGYGQITEHWKQTAHNAYLLAPAELGLPGTFLWYGLSYVTFKVLLNGRKRVKDRPEAKVALIWVDALLAAHAGMHFGICFLSWCYQYIYWFYTGLVGAFYKALKSHDPEWEVDIGPKDLAKNAGIMAGILTFWNFAINRKYAKL